MEKTYSNITAMTITELEELADFYLVDISDVVDEYGRIVIPEKSPYGFTANDVHPDDFKAISQFGRIVKNYQKLMNINKTN